MDLGLKAETSAQKIVLEYLEANVSEVLAEKIKSGNKTLGQCWTYITKQAQKQKNGNCACIPDIEVFGWAVHFFEEDQIREEETKPIAKVEVKKQNPAPVVRDRHGNPKKAAEPKQSDMLPGQMTIFDMWGGADES